MREKLLFDASSVIYALKLRNLRILYDNYIQWLTIYEVINALWKEAALTKAISLQEAFKIVGLFAKTLEFMKILSPHPHEDKILSMAKELNITAYDASYLILAKENNLTLVTEDKKLKTKAEKLVKAINLTQITT
ncbi:MAG: type II toxin-antitoxin system VapC family toxin [Thaumarchaeota archaeon]|nr:type II toxin-antitoxin system VapC family toxin [Nitrososphaerota archaeon]